MMMNHAGYSAVMPAPWGRIGIRCSALGLTEIVYLPESVPLADPQAALAEHAVRELEAYLSDPDVSFDLPLAIAGTAYRQQVWTALRTIPRGQVVTYGALARQLGSAARAVGQACGDNPFPIVIPCHRVVAQTGLGGFAHDADARGFFAGIKRWLLAHEGYCNV